MAHWECATLRAAFQGWLEAAEKLQRKQDAAQRAAGMFMYRRVALPFRQWRERAVRKREMRGKASGFLLVGPSSSPVFGY